MTARAIASEVQGLVEEAERNPRSVGGSQWAEPRIRLAAYGPRVSRALSMAAEYVEQRVYTLGDDGLPYVMPIDRTVRHVLIGEMVPALVRALVALVETIESLSCSCVSAGPRAPGKVCARCQDLRAIEHALEVLP